jgi:hypothetical protein
MSAFVVRSAGTLAAAVVAGLATSASAFSPTCESWKGGWEIRCLSVNSETLSTITQVVYVESTASAPVSFRQQQWDSQCGMPGSTKADAVDVTIQPGARIAFLLDTPPFGGLGARCTEIFFFSCAAGGADVRCMDKLGATIELPQFNLFGVPQPFGPLFQ